MLIKLFNKIYQFVLNSKILKTIFYFTLIIYPFAFFIVYQKSGLRAIGIHTNIIIPLYLIVFLDILIQYFHRLSDRLSKIKHFVSVYLIIELFLIIIRPENIYIPSRNGQYFGLYETKDISYHHIEKPNRHYRYNESEYDFERTANSIGLPDTEWSKNKSPQTLRILCTGDSFTEGDGAHIDSSYVSFLRRDLHRKFSNIEVLNAGTRGSDPFYNFQYLKDKLIEYQPDIIIQSFTTNDFYFDFLFRGGSERFVNNHTLKFRKNYWWEPIYAASYISRIFIQTIGGYDKYLIREKELSSFYLEMEEKSIELFKNYQAFTHNNNIELLVFTIPFKSDLQGGTENSEFYKKFRKDFAKFNLNFYNLQPCYEEYISHNNSTYKDYYWKHDGHHNAKGYEMMAKCIGAIIQQHPLLSNRITNE